MSTARAPPAAQPMVDTHCHLLHALDDGPRTQEAALELALALSAIGVEHVVATPHLSRRFPTERARALGRARRLRAELTEAAVDLRISVAAEISPATALTLSLEALEAHSIARLFVLVELEPGTRADFVTALLARFSSTALIPIIAHPERCRALRQRPRLLDSARRVGALVQVVAPSLAGHSKSTADAAWAMLERGQVDLLASDAHAAPGAADLADAADAVASRLGRAFADELTRTRPALVASGRHPDAVRR